MGLGKTVQAVSTINYLHKTYNLRGPYLVVAERHPPHLGLNIDRIRKSAQLLQTVLSSAAFAVFQPWAYPHSWAT